MWFTLEYRNLTLRRLSFLPSSSAVGCIMAHVCKHKKDLKVQKETVTNNYGLWRNYNLYRQKHLTISNCVMAKPFDTVRDYEVAEGLRSELVCGLNWFVV